MPPVPREVDLIQSGARDSEQPRLAARSVPQTCILRLLMSKEELCVKSGQEGSVGLIPETEMGVLAPETPETCV